MEKHLVEKDKYELDEIEKMTLKMLKDNTKQARDFYDSCKRKQHKFESMLIQSIDKDIYDGKCLPEAVILWAVSEFSGAKFQLIHSSALLSILDSTAELRAKPLRCRDAGVLLPRFLPAAGQ